MYTADHWDVCLEADSANSEPPGPPVSVRFGGGYAQHHEGWARETSIFRNPPPCPSEGPDHGAHTIPSGIRKDGPVEHDPPNSPVRTPYRTPWPAPPVKNGASPREMLRLVEVSTDVATKVHRRLTAFLAAEYNAKTASRIPKKPPLTPFRVLGQGADAWRTVHVISECPIWPERPNGTLQPQNCDPVLGQKSSPVPIAFLVSYFSLLVCPRKHPIVSLLQDGDVESNPGPTGPPGYTEDYQLSPDIFRDVPRLLNCPHPWVDAFAAPHNCLIPTYWSANHSAFDRNWRSCLLPIWANPPFSLLHRVLAKIRTEGAYMLLLCPAWEPTISEAKALAVRGHLLPRTKMFRKEGKALMPAPKWGVWILLIDYYPPRSGRGLSLLSCGDIESNPGPRQGPSACSWDPLWNFMQDHMLDDWVHVIMFEPPEMGPSGGLDTGSFLWFDATCEACGRSWSGYDTFVVTQHLTYCKALEEGTGGRLLHLRQIHKATGRGESLLSCGDIESNPGPEHTDQRSTRLRQTRSASRVNAPIAPDGPLSQNDAMLVDPSVPTVEVSSSSSVPRQRRDVMCPCPMEGCPLATRHMSHVSLVAHLARTHVIAGEAVPAALLAQIGHSVCTACRNLYPGAGACAFCTAKARRAPGEAGSDPVPFPERPVQPQHVQPKGTSLNAPSPLFQPPLDELLQAQIPTVRHLPNACRREFAEVLGELLASLAEEPTWEAVYGLMALPKLVLRAPNTRADSKPSNLSLDIARRLRLFRSGAWPSLWTEVRPARTEGPKRRPLTRSRSNQETLPPSVVDTIKGLVEEGAFSKAAKHLVSRGLADISDPDVSAKLASLHPRGSPVHVGGDSALPERVDVGWELHPDDWDTLCLTAIQGFPSGSAPGPSGLRPSHLKDCLKRAGSISALKVGLRKFVQAAISGHLPRALHPVLCAANLIPLNKKDGGIRPIAIGDTLRRLVGKVLLRTTRVRAEVEGLQPRQVGVSVPFAAELVGMGVQRLADTVEQSNWAVLQVDVSNAFNSVDRSAILLSAQVKAPSTYNWLTWCYRENTQLFCQGKSVAVSSTGVHQGDAMGPLGFALGLEKALDMCKDADAALPWSTWYLDDGTLVGTPESLADYLECLVPALASVGLEVNLRKCCLWGPACTTDSTMTEDGLPENLSLHHPLRKVPVVPYGSSTGITVLGVPVDAPGSLTHAKHKWSETVQHTATTLEALRQYPNAQVRHCLLRHCLDACKVNHLMRACPEAAGSEAILRMNCDLKQAVTDLVGCGLSIQAWEQATLAISMGGLGVKDPVKLCPQARIAALANFHQRASGVGIPSEIAQALAPDLTSAIQSVAANVGPNHELLAIWADDERTFLSADSNASSQSWWADQADKVRKGRLPYLGGTARDAVRIQAQDGPIATGWLSVIPSRTSNSTLSDDEFRTLCRWWLGLPLLSDGACVLCPACGECADPFGDHFVSCRKNGFTRRHNSLRDELCRTLAAGGITYQKEVMVRDMTRPADILLHGWDKAVDVCVDLTITHPVQAESWPLGPETAALHLSKAEKDKNEKHKEVCKSMRWACHPMALTPWGGCGRSAKTLLFELTRRIAGDLLPPMRDERIRNIRENLSLSLAREVAKQLSIKNLVLEALD